MELRLTETNSADDSAGRAFGLEGNLYLPVTIAVVAGLLAFGAGAYGLQLPWLPMAACSALPFLLTLGWVIFLRHGRPRGFDRDLWEYWRGGGDFGPEDNRP